MNKKDMVTRLIFQNEVYYRLKDVAQLREVTVARLKRAIEKLGIPTVTIEGFGRVKWIKEQYVSEIEINDEVVVMRTEFKDYQTELEIQGKITALANAFFNKETTVKEIVDKTEKSMNDFALSSYVNTRALEDNEKRQQWNEMFERCGIADRYRKIEFLVNNEVCEIGVFVNGEGKIVDGDSNAVFGCILDGETLELVETDLKDGILYNESGEQIPLTFGEPFECKDMNMYLLNELIDSISRNGVDMFTNDWVDFKLDNGGYVGVKLDTFLDMHNHKIVAVC